MRDQLIDGFKDSLVDGLKNRTLTSCYRWATRRRIIQGVEDNLPAAYSGRLHPWVVGMHDSDARYNYAMKGAQLGVTEVAINRALYVIDKMKRDVLYVLPTSTTAGDFSKARFGGALSLSPYLKSLFTDTNAVNLKQAGSNTLYIRGSRGDSNLVSIPVSELFLDEVDRMEQKQVWLALERLSGKIDKHVWGISTPTIPNYGIHKLFMGGTQEHFVFQCPRCSKWTELIWPECIEIVGEHVTDARCDESFLKCKECNGRLEHKDKPNFLKNAIWKAFEENANPNVRSFYINQLYSFTITPGELVVAHFRGLGDELAQKEFHNSKLGMPFIGDGAAVDDVMLDRSVEAGGGYTMQGGRPKQAGRMIVMGIDRGKWNYYEVCEYFFENAGLDLNAASTCKVLAAGKFLEEHFDQTVDALMREWQILGCVVDADPGPMEARRFARRFPGYVWLCRYRKGVTAKEIAISEEEDDAPIATVDRSNWMSASLGRFKTDPTRITLPADISKEYREHTKAPTSTYVRDDFGNPSLEFISTGPDHFGHARTYAEIALPLAASRVLNSDIKKFL
jgi:hypothetical protein